MKEWQIPVHKTFTIKNTSSAIAYWRFVRKVEDAEVCKRWLSLDVTQGLLLPNEVRGPTVSTVS